VLLIECPDGEKEPTKYWLSTLPAGTAITALVDTAKLRWRIERDFQDLKQEIGLDHYEGRGWRGFHHHAALSIVAYGFLVAKRSSIPPSATIIASLGRQIPAQERGYCPRGAPAA
jgi:SRSO17 transposase